MSKRTIISDRAKFIDAKLAEEVAKTAPSASIPQNLSIDELLLKALNEVRRLLDIIGKDIGTNAPSRETVMNLKDCTSMLMSLKEHEKDVLDSMTDEQIEEVANK
jgi:hypothetical protein